MKCNHFLYATLLLISLALASPIRANTLSYQGNFPSDDFVQTFNFNLASAGAVTLQTFGYAGGINGAGKTIAAGGFDPVITLFDGAGNFLTSNNDGACGQVGTDATTLNCFDSYLSLTLGAGSYSLALTENDNLAAGPTFADGFTQAGNGNFTCAEFMGTPGGFCDASPSQRNSAWALDVTTPATAPVPEPSTYALLLSGIGVFFITRKHFLHN
jgi:hypothetical protein